MLYLVRLMSHIKGGIMSKHKTVSIVRSETWMKADIDYLYNILNETIETYLDDNSRIINIEQQYCNNGLYRYVIYFYQD